MLCFSVAVSIMKIKLAMGFPDILNALQGSWKHQLDQLKYFSIRVVESIGLILALSHNYVSSVSLGLEHFFSTVL